MQWTRSSHIFLGQDNTQVVGIGVAHLIEDGLIPRRPWIRGLIPIFIVVVVGNGNGLISDAR